jgi:hypothetical protein
MVLGGLVALIAAYYCFKMSIGKGSFGDLVMGVAPMLAVLGVSFGFSPRAKSALQSAMESGDTQVVGHLFEALGSGDAELMAQARQALIGLLPMVKMGHFTLDQVQHEALIQGMAGAGDSFLLAVVRALPVVGRRESIPMLERLAEGSALQLGRPVSHAVRAAAGASLPLLRMELARGIIEKAAAEADARRLLIEAKLSAAEEQIHLQA